MSEEKPKYVEELPGFDKIREFKVKYNDVFHLKNFYVMFHEYLIEEGFLDADQTQNPMLGHCFVEVLYLEKYIQKGLHRGGKEMWVWWRTIKMPEGKYSGYIRYRLDFDFHVVYMVDLEVMHMGKKMKINKGEMEVMIRPRVEVDYRGEWEKHWLLKHYQDFYLRRVLKQELEKRQKDIWREAYRFQGKIKNFLGMRTFIPIPEPFWMPNYGYENVGVNRQ